MNIDDVRKAEMAQNCASDELCETRFQYLRERGWDRRPLPPGGVMALQKTLDDGRTIIVDTPERAVAIQAALDQVV